MSYKLIKHTIGGKDFLVYKIKNVTYYKRWWFRISNRDHPYVLSIEYMEPHSVPSINHAYVGGNIGYTTSHEYRPTTTYDIYMISEERCLEVIDDIKYKKKVIADITDGIAAQAIANYEEKNKLKLEST